MDFLHLLQSTNNNTNYTAYIDDYNEAINVTKAGLPYMKGIVSLVAVSSAIIIFFTCYVIVRTLKIH